MKKLSIYILILTLAIFSSISITDARQSTDSDSLSNQPFSLSGMKLRGTLFTRDMKPMAIIENTDNGQVTMYEEGDLINGFEIAEISRGKALFKSPGSEFSLSLPVGGIWQPDGFSPDSNRWYDIRREGDSFVVSRSTVSNAIDRIKSIMPHVRIKPWFSDGKRSGVVVSRFMPIGILSEVGVREGDVIKSINGYRLNSPYQIFKAYRILKDQQELKVDIIRDNKPLMLTYKVKI